MTKLVPAPRVAAGHSSVLADGRAAFAERRWEDAYAGLSAADLEQPLDSRDLALLGASAALTRRDEVASQLQERGYAACLAEKDELGAARAAFWHGFRLASLGETGRAKAWLARCERLLENHDECAERGYLMLPRIHELLRVGNTQGAHAVALAALAIGDRFGEPDLSALARQLGGRALIESGDVAGGMQLLDDAMLIATTEPVSELSKGLVYCAVVGSCQRIFAVDRAREWSAVLDAWCAAQAQLGMFSGTCRVHRAELMRLGGAWSDALDEVLLVASGATADQHERSAAYYEQAEIHRLRGHVAEAELAYEHVSELGGDPQPGLALLRLEQGRLDVAVGAIRRAVATTRSALSRARFLPACVEILLAADEQASASQAAQDLAEIADCYGTPVLRALSAQARGFVALAAGESGDALVLLREALGIWLELAAPYSAARVRVGLSAAYAALSDIEGARLEFAAARAVFADLAAGPDLLHLGPPERGRAAAGLLLSSRELQVLRLAATGRTNKEIATTLGLSARTIDRHVSNILTKLSVPSRAAATSYAYENGLIYG
ncbi:helix-turn-helix transcriptional regulator [Rathayibacter soli]|uniref:helix-turn-helix transcriptional regulator n=1 Tax=Rathayibacter soli TaxID=3144168 RepID=UPI0027E4FE45|nr:LuxR C-terminal-related transcriptional regulator [Glaciibacter superstes]